MLRSETVSTVSPSALRRPLRSATPLQPSSSRQPDRHDQIRRVVGSALNDRRAQRADQTQPQVISGDGLDSFAHELRIESDLHRLAGERDRKCLLRLANILRSCEHAKLALRKPKLNRRRALHEHTDASYDVEELGAWKCQLVLERLRQELPVVRELSVDAAGRQPDIVGSEDNLILVNPELDSVA